MIAYPFEVATIVALHSFNPRHAHGFARAHHDQRAGSDHPGHQGGVR